MKPLQRMNELRIKSSNLRRVAFDIKDLKKAGEIRKEQDDCYKRFMFYKNISNAIEKVKNETII